jgi:dienelactone hydrolase
MNEMPTDRKRIIVFGFCLGGAALFMYLSFIAKVVFSGP